MRKKPVQYAVGIGGWEHESFNQFLYDFRTENTDDKLRQYSRYFDVAEVRSTFWDDSLWATDAMHWLAAVEDNKRFRFTVKLHKSFTHSRDFKPQLTSRVRGLLQELQKNERLGALLLQFPYSFTNTSSNRFHLIKLSEIFRGFPMHAEFRHESWNQSNLISLLAENNLAPVSADFPRLKSMMPFSTGVVGDSAFLRLHGRNEKGWLTNGMDTRYDYLYNGKELREIKRRLSALEEKCSNITIIFNNTTGGKAIANAFQLMAQLREGKPVLVPQASLKAFPYLLEDLNTVVEDGLFAGEKLYRRAG